MEKFQLDQYDMLLSVENHFNDNPTAWAGNVPVTNAKNALSAKIAAIANQMAIQLVNSVGITEDKQAIRTKLEDQAFIISSGICAYATSIANNELYNKVYNARSTYLRYRDAELQGVCTNLVLDANAHIANLAPFGILPATVTNLTTLQNSFAAIMKNPTEAIGKRKAATEKLQVLLPDAIKLLNESMDNLMVVLGTTQPAFVDVYNNVRLISSSPTNPWSLTTTCLDKLSEQPVEGVTLKIVDTNIVRTSPASGFNTYQNISEGEHIISVSHPNYKSQDVSFTVVGSITTELAILLEE